MKETHQKKLLIENMVCQRCILTVESILKDLDVSFSEVVLGEVDLVNDLSANQLNELDKAFVKLGFELIETRVNKIIASVICFLPLKVLGLKNNLSFSGLKK